MTSNKTYKLFTDGGSRGNPGLSASAFFLFDENNSLIDFGGIYNGITTNNRAEYEGLLLGITKCVKLGIKSVEVMMDSELIVKQINGEYKISDSKMKELNTKVHTLLKSFDDYKFKHVRRENNKFADKLVNLIMDNSR